LRAAHGAEVLPVMRAGAGFIFQGASEVCPGISDYNETNIHSVLALIFRLSLSVWFSGRMSVMGKLASVCDNYLFDGFIFSGLGVLPVFPYQQHCCLSF